MKFDFSLILASLPKIAQGVGLTLQLLMLALAIGSSLGLFSYFLRGTPMLVQIFLVYYGLSQFESVRNSALWPILREPYWCAVIALSLNCAAYTSEILRGGIQAVDNGLHEAGRALGMSPSQRFLHVTAPIAFRLALPAYGNEIISLLKGTSLVSLITLSDITGVARDIVSRTFAPYEIFISAALVYLCITWCLQFGMRQLEHRFSRYVRK